MVLILIILLLCEAYSKQRTIWRIGSNGGCGCWKETIPVEGVVQIRVDSIVDGAAGWTTAAIVAVRVVSSGTEDMSAGGVVWGSVFGVGARRVIWRDGVVVGLVGGGGAARTGLVVAERHLAEWVHGAHETLGVGQWVGVVVVVRCGIAVGVAVLSDVMGCCGGGIRWVS